ncbi:MAG: methyltransferase [Bacteroidia bacterium]|jgi:SAM-dependent methyltransferase
MEPIGSSSKTEFDNFANDYDTLLQKSISASGYEAAFFDEHKIKTLYSDYTRDGSTSKKNIHIMNFGCGTGKSEKYINKYFTDCHICSVDVSERSIDVARQKNKEYRNTEFLKFDRVEELSALNKKFDIIFVANVFHHIPEELHHTTLKYLRSFLSPTGYLYVFEHNPKNPLTRKVFETCEFDVGCKMIKPPLFIQMCKEEGYTTIIRNYVLFFPKFLSFLGPFEKLLKWCPFGAQYYIKAK